MSVSLVTHLPARQNVAGQLDLGKVSFADGLEQAVVAYVRLFVGARGNRVPAPGTQRAAGLAGGLIWAAGPQWHMLEENEGEEVRSVCQQQYDTEQQQQAGKGL